MLSDWQMFSLSNFSWMEHSRQTQELSLIAVPPPYHFLLSFLSLHLWSFFSPLPQRLLSVHVSLCLALVLGDRYTIKVRSTDQGGLSIGNSFTIYIQNVNEKPTAVKVSCCDTTWEVPCHSSRLLEVDSPPLPIPKPSQPQTHPSRPYPILTPTLRAMLPISVALNLRIVCFVLYEDFDQNIVWL